LEGAAEGKIAGVGGAEVGNSDEGGVAAAAEASGSVPAGRAGVGIEDWFGRGLVPAGSQARTIREATNRPAATEYRMIAIRLI